MSPLVLAAAVWVSAAAVGILLAILLTLRGTMSRAIPRATPQRRAELAAFNEFASALVDAFRQIRPTGEASLNKLADDLNRWSSRG